jgi:ABC-type uncharacterized transport system substrate-binding protein
MSRYWQRDATSTIPIVFRGVDHPVKLGIVASFSHPGGNLTGVSLFNAVLGAKRLELLRELVPGTTTIAVLVNPKNPTTKDQTDLQAAARTSGQDIKVFNAALTQTRSTPLLRRRRKGGRCTRRGCRAARDRLPTMYGQRGIAAIGGLIS